MPRNITGFSKPGALYEVDADNMHPAPDLEAEFHAGASAEEGVSGLKAIDTTFENTSQDIVEKPRSAYNSPAPADLDDYPHRRY